jgi:hypothetical protein
MATLVSSSLFAVVFVSHFVGHFIGNFVFGAPATTKRQPPGVGGSSAELSRRTLARVRYKVCGEVSDEDCDKDRKTAGFRAALDFPFGCAIWYLD